MTMSAGLKAFLGLLFAVGAGAVFVVPKLLERDAASVASQVVSSETGTGAEETAASPPQADPSGTASDAGSSDQEIEVASLGETLEQPSFDVLRVEPDGSTVIAGKAEPNTTLDIMNGDTVIASAAVGPSGDFAAILDAPLAPGDYQLTLRTMGDNGEVQVSEEVATVSIPDTPEGELLAMVSKPGKASRIIAQPAAPAQPAAATDADESDAVEDVADASDVNTASDVASVSDVEATAEPETEVAAASTDGQGAAQDTAIEDTAIEAEPQNLSEVRIETPALPEMSSLLTTSAPRIEAESAEVAAPEAAPAPEESAGDSGDQTGPEQTGPEQAEVAMVSPEAAEPAASEPQVDVSVRVDAVEIEGSRIFIAGSATPGYPVTVSADGLAIGTEKTDSDGRFILEADADLSVGEHIITADLIDPASGEILLRATVPFNRPEGEALAAVSPATPEAPVVPDALSTPVSEPAPEPVADEAEAAPTSEGLILPDIASISQLREEAFEALAALEQMVSAEVTPERAEIAAARDAALAKLKAASMADLSADSGAEALAMAESIRAQAKGALSVLAPESGVQTTDAGSDILTGDMADMRELLGQARAALSKPSQIAIAVANEAATDGSAGEPRTIQQAPLASAPGAVIIRRGDTLWQISRRTYGQGVRYTTIYLANRSQIVDPDRIQPGQVFSVPETPLENAEALHRRRLEGDSLR
ncbi:LysM peptidoglycan-binding domain-containing protein [Hoeflea sp.]|uniref:LysM peptidoglycan-binding domain-containing protein n=1 Tax=Hoeflea sp. TaxID=1940281 RepID=UPI00374A4921